MVARIRPAAALPTESDSDALSAPPPALRPTGAVRLLVSACLLGENVRCDGQHKYDAFLSPYPAEPMLRNRV